jgi:antitoxin MazE
MIGLDFRPLPAYLHYDTTGARGMKVEFRKWGNSLALRIPRDFANDIGARDGKAAEMTVADGKLVVEVAKPKRNRRYTIEQLVAGITPENRHEEIDWGPDVGAEIIED